MLKPARILMFAALLLVSLGLLASPRGFPPPKGEGSPDKDVSMFMAMMIQQELELSDEQTLQVKRHLQEIEAYRRQQKEARREILEKIRELLQGEGNDRELEKAVRDLQAHKAEVDKEVNRLEVELLTFLTPRQQAKYLLFERTFRERIKDRMRQFREGKRPFRDGTKSRSRKDG